MWTGRPRAVRNWSQPRARRRIELRVATRLQRERLAGYGELGVRKGDCSSRPTRTQMFAQYAETLPSRSRSQQDMRQNCIITAHLMHSKTICSLPGTRWTHDHLSKCTGMFTTVLYYIPPGPTRPRFSIHRVVSKSSSTSRSSRILLVLRLSRGERKRRAEWFGGVGEAGSSR